VDFNLAKCARCDSLFNKIVSEVCEHCQPDEDADYNRIHDVISRTPGLTAQQLADETTLGIDCVLRMMREGRIDNVESADSAKCGRCGAAAISATKRLCERCLVDLDRECAQAMLEMRQRIRSREESDMNDIQTAVSEKRASKREQRREPAPATPAAKATTGRGMVVQERLRRKRS
jgi:hypothetical protein